MKPMVILGSNGVINEAFHGQKIDFAGRPVFNFKELTLVTKNSDDVIFTDWGRPWEVLRRVAHSASRKFAVNPDLPGLEVGVIDEVVDTIMSKEGLNSPFNPKDYIYLMVYSIIASTVAGKSYSLNDREFLRLKEANDLATEKQSVLFVVEFLPFMKYVYRKSWSEILKVAKVQIDWCIEQFDSHMKTYTPGNVRDFCDALIHAKEEAEVSDAEAVVHLNRENLINVIVDLFQAGTETTRMTLSWAFLILANYPNVQAKVRAEVDQVIGDDIPTNDHRLNCHYVQAFISEVLRFAPIVPIGLPHKSIIESSVAGITIPKNTTVISLLIAQLHDKEIWGDPEVFRPERFLDPQTGVHTTRKNNAFTPFSVGRRSCLGEKLAIINLFIEITRFIQKTRGMKIVLPNGPGSGDFTPDLNQSASYATRDYEIMLVKE